MTLQAVIFDVDGTLADTEEVHRLAFNAAFHDKGLPWKWDVPLYRQLLSVTGGKERIRHFCETQDRHFLEQPAAKDVIAELHAGKTRHYTRLVHEGAVPPRSGVIRLLHDLSANGIRLAIATTTTRANVDALLEASFSSLPASAAFEVIGAAEEVPVKKPAPDIYLWALEKLGLAPGDCLAIEDSRNGLLAGRGAGLPVVVTECAWTEGGNFSEALAVYSDLGEPGHPHRVLHSPVQGPGYLDAAGLQRLHEAWTGT
jgi:HAD superfamily hydrolase (TIGR01509 family)